MGQAGETKRDQNFSCILKVFSNLLQITLFDRDTVVLPVYSSFPPPFLSLHPVAHPLTPISSSINFKPGKNDTYDVGKKKISL